jgi:hypothetical protein
MKSICIYLDFLTRMYSNSIRKLSCFSVKNFNSKVIYSNNKIFSISSKSHVKQNRNKIIYFISLNYGAITGTLTGIWYLKEDLDNYSDSTSEVLFFICLIHDKICINFHTRSFRKNRI